MNRQFLYLALLAPGLLTLCVIVVYPAFLTVLYSFERLHLVFPGSQFIGLENYAEVFRLDSGLYGALWKTVVWTVSTVSAQLVLGMILALALNNVRRCAAVFRVLLIVPWTFPGVSLAFIFLWMFEPTLGIVNYTLLQVGVISENIGWFGSADRAMLSVIMMDIWFGIPFMMIALVAGLQTIPKELREAARIDGASAWREFQYVTLPELKKIIIVIVLLRGLWNFNNFEFIFLTTGGGPADRTNILPLLIYQTGWREMWLGKAATLAVVSLAVLALVTMLMLRNIDEGPEDAH